MAAELLVLRPDIKVLYVSGYTANVMSQHGHDEAEFAFLEKPFAPGALLAKVGEVLDS